MERESEGEETEKGGGAQAECGGGCWEKEKSEEGQRSTSFFLLPFSPLSLSLPVSFFLSLSLSVNREATSSATESRKTQRVPQRMVRLTTCEEKRKRAEAPSPPPFFAPQRLFLFFVLFACGPPLTRPFSVAPAPISCAFPCLFRWHRHGRVSSWIDYLIEEETRSPKKPRSLLLRRCRRARPPPPPPPLPPLPERTRGLSRRPLSSSRRSRPPTWSTLRQRPLPRPWRGGLSWKRFVFFFSLERLFFLPLFLSSSPPLLLPSPSFLFLPP